jgi:TRAP-type C4-dicarboxylate transport system permease small subunit
MTPSDSPAAGEAPSLWRRFTAAYASLLSHLVVASVAILIIPVSLQIFSRHTSLIPSYIWTEEMARFLFIWTISIGAMIGVRESTHFEVDVMPELPPRAEAVARLVGRVGTLVLAGVFVFAGIKFVEFAWWRTSELADLPLWLIHLPWPLMGVTWIVFLGEQMWDDVLVAAGRKAPPVKPAVSDIEAGTLNL